MFKRRKKHNEAVDISDSVEMERGQEMAPEPEEEGPRSSLAHTHLSGSPSPHAPPERRQHAKQTIIGMGVNFHGRINGVGVIEIGGDVTGEIVANDVLVIGETANVKANIHVGTAVIKGSLEGDVDANEVVEIKGKAHVQGHISTPALSIEKGARFNGSCKMKES